VAEVAVTTLVAEEVLEAIEQHQALLLLPDLL
jgi:quinolinate synthase